MPRRFLTNSQEEYIYKELGEGHLDIDELPCSLSFSNLSQEQFFQTLPDDNGYVEKEQQEVHQSMVDEKRSLEPTIAMMQQLQQLIPPTPILGKDDYPGPFNFQLILHPQSSGKHWNLSEKLSKVFIHMEEVLPVQFQWTPPQDLLWVRATMVYKLDQHRSQPVARCHNHMAPDNNSNRNIDPRQVKHVIRCLHPTSTYEEGTNGHLSVLTPLGTPEAGINNVPMDFKFFCKNSCNSGMNRRPTEVIFTLETEQNQILGRRKLEVRVCSCPKRDKEKEEKEFDSTNVMPVLGHGKKRKLNPASVLPPPSGKKLIVADNKVYPLNINIIGKDNYNAVLKYAHDVMAGAAIRTGNIDSYKQHMDDVLKKSL